MPRRHRTSARVGGAFLASGVASWTLDQDAAKVLDLTGYPLLPDEPVMLLIRNGSATVALTARYGPMAFCSDVDERPTAVACVMNDVAATITSAAHGLVVGDAIVFSTTAGGVTAGIVYYVIAVSDANTFQIATAREAAALNISADIANAYSLTSEQFSQGTVTVPAWVAATSTTLALGLVATRIDSGAAPFRVTLTKSAAPAAIFTAYVELRRA